MLKKTILICLALVLAARFYLAITRYLDPDEFAHLHWTYLIAHGFLPYKDFFLYHIPFFQWLLTPLFLLPPGWYLVILSRIIIWIIYALNAFLLFKITKKITNNEIASLFSSLLVLIFPMTFDKSIEIRPDHFMVFFFLLSLLVRHPFLKGILYALSIITFPKILFTLPAMIFLERRKIIPFITGILVPPALVSSYFAVSGILFLAIRANTADAAAVSAGKGAFSLTLALSPYPLVYVIQAGPSLPWLINSAIWILAVLGLFMLWKKSKNYAIFFFLFFAGAILFLYLFPAPYTQYFLPLSYFGSLLTAIVLSKFRFQIFIILLLLISFWQQWQLRIVSGNDNSEQKQVIENILKISKPNDTVYDMIGSYIFRPDGYYICCHPYAEFIDRLSYKIPTLRDSLRARHTKFLILDRTGQSLWKPKPDDLEFLKALYIPSQYPKIYVLQ